MKLWFNIWNRMQIYFFFRLCRLLCLKLTQALWLNSIKHSTMIRTELLSMVNELNLSRRMTPRWRDSSNEFVNAKLFRCSGSGVVRENHFWNFFPLRAIWFYNKTFKTWKIDCKSKLYVFSRHFNLNLFSLHDGANKGNMMSGYDEGRAGRLSNAFN